MIVRVYIYREFLIYIYMYRDRRLKFKLYECGIITLQT